MSALLSQLHTSDTSIGSFSASVRISGDIAMFFSGLKKSGNRVDGSIDEF
jgi:hypothetical protein